MALYEHVLLARQDVSAQQVEALVEQFKGVIEANGGAIRKVEYWGVKSLGYRIKKNRKAHYTLLNIEGPSAAVLEMERQMRINEDILRFMTIKVDELEEGPSAMLQKRDRDDRPERGGDRFERGPRRDRPRREDEATETAEAAGLRPTPSPFPMIIQTANGSVRADTATVPELRIGNIVARDLPVVSSPAFGDMDVIGMNFLSRLQGWRVEGDWLILQPAPQ